MRVMVYAKECLDREAEELSRSVDLFTLPVESFSGGKQPIRKRLLKTINALSDAPTTNTVDYEQQRVEAEFSRQIMAAIDAGDSELASELERKWNQQCEQRKANKRQDDEDGGATMNIWEGDVSLLVKARMQGY